MPLLSGMKPDGFYDKHSSFQERTMLASIGRLEVAIAGMRFPAESQPFTIADYGCSEGKNSIVAVGRIAAAVRARRPRQPLVAIHTDLASNNFNQLLANLNNPESSNYYQDRGRLHANVFSLACGGSFYETLLPPGSVHVATSFLAVEWMDRVPELSLPGSLSYHKGTTDLRNAFARQADDDLTKFLTYRAAELAPGGKLLVVIPGADEHARCGDGLIDVLDDAVRDLVAAGRILQEKFDQFLLPVYYRTLKEMTEPVTRPGSSLAGACSIEQAETLHIPVSFVEEFRHTGDTQAYAAAFTGFLRAFSEPVTVAALRASPADTQLGDAIYTRVHERLAKEPDRYALQNIEVAVLYSRR